MQPLNKQLLTMISNEMPDTLGFMIVHTGKLLLKTINLSFAGINKEITFEQMGVLYFISRNDGKKDMIQQDIAEIMDKNKSAVLRSIDILEQKSFVKRVPALGDRRKNITQEIYHVCIRRHCIRRRTCRFAKSLVEE